MGRARLYPWLGFRAARERDWYALGEDLLLWWLFRLRF